MIETVGGLFDGIGGFGIAAHAHGIRTAWNVELADYPGRVLKARFPAATRLTDVRDVRNPPRVDVLTGGFPCQDLSLAGLGAGIAGSRSGLWTEFARIIGEVEPELVLIENVPALLHRGFELVVDNLVELGYAVEWDCLPAVAFGAPHLRDRVWIAAHRQAEPIIFGQPAALFALEPAGAADLVGGDDDPDDDEPADAGWWRWPRAGFVAGDPRLVMPLEPLARARDAARGRVLLPTPMAANGENTSEQGPRYYAHGTDNPTLLGAARRLDETDLLPTLTAHDGKNSGASQLGRRSPGLATLAEFNLWPTPQASDYQRDTYQRTPSQQAGKHGLYLHTEAVEAEVAAGRLADNDRIARGKLHPGWVEWLMGFPLGWTDLTVANTDLRPHPWHLGDPPDVPRVTVDTPHRRDRLKALGNALIPAAPEWMLARYRTATEEAQAA